MESGALKRTAIGMVLFAVTFISCITGDEEEPWRYFGIYGVSNWSLVAADCDEKTHTHQSPININMKDTEYDPSLTPIRLVLQRAFSKDTITMVNNGHTVSFNYDNSVARISGGHLNGTFRVAGIHFHWGSKNNEGSEHTFDSKRFPIEMHVVTYDEKRFSGVLNATGAVNSLAVLSVLFTHSFSDNRALHPIISRFKDVTVAGTSVRMPYFDVNTLLPADTSKYFRYSGSLTTPPCAESLGWSVFQTHQHISSAQLNSFRRLQEQIEPDGVIDYLVDNWRPIQPLYGRTVQNSFRHTAHHITVSHPTIRSDAMLSPPTHENKGAGQQSSVFVMLLQNIFLYICARLKL